MASFRDRILAQAREMDGGSNRPSTTAPKVQDSVTPFAPAYTAPKQETAPAPTQENKLPDNWISRDGFAMDEELGEKFGTYENYMNGVVTDTWRQKADEARKPIKLRPNEQAAHEGQIAAYEQRVSQYSGANQYKTESTEAAKMGMTVAEFRAYQREKYALEERKSDAEMRVKPVEAAANTLRQMQDEINYLSKPNYGAGNIDLSATPRFDNGDGTYSTVDSVSFFDDKTGLEILIPTVIQGKDGQWAHVDVEDAIEHYRRTGKYLGAFKTAEEANAYANQLHEQQEQLFARRSELSAQYKAAADAYTNLYNQYASEVADPLTKSIDAFNEQYEPVGYFLGKGTTYDEIKSVIDALAVIMATVPAGSDEYNSAKRRYDALNAGRMAFATDDELRKMEATSGSKSGDGTALTSEARKAIAERTDYLIKNNLPVDTDPELQKLMREGTVQTEAARAGAELALRDTKFVVDKASGDAKAYLDAIAYYSANGNLDDPDAKAVADTARKSLGRDAKRYGTDLDVLEAVARKALVDSGVSEQVANNATATLIREGNRIRTERHNAMLSGWAGSNVLAGTAATLLSFATNLLSPVGVLEELRASLDGSTYHTMDPNSPFFAGAQTTNALRGGVQEAVDWKAGQVDLFDATYGIITSSVDSMLAAYMGGGAQIGLQAAAQTMLETTQNGGTIGDAFEAGIFAGIFETLFETISISQFKRMKETNILAGSLEEIISRNQVKTIGLNLLKSFVANGSEELATEIANVVFDYLKYEQGATGTNFATKLAEYEAKINLKTGKPYTTDEARAQVAGDLAKQVAYAGVTGALQGVLMGTVSQLGAIKVTGQLRDMLVNPSAEQKGIIHNICIGEAYDPESQTYAIATELSRRLKNALEGEGSGKEAVIRFFEENTDRFAELNTALAAEMREYGPENYTPALYQAQQEAVKNNDATPPHVETPIEARVRAAQESAGMTGAEASATRELLMAVFNGESRLRFTDAGSYLDSENFKNAVKELTGVAVEGETKAEIKKSLKEIARVVDKRNTVNLTPTTETVQTQDDLVQPTEDAQAVAPAAQETPGATTPDGRLKLNDIVTPRGRVRVRVAQSGQTQNAEAQTTPAQTQNAEAQPAQEANREPRIIEFSAAEGQTPEAKPITMEQHRSEQILNALLEGTGLSVKVVSGDPALVGANGMHLNGTLIVNADAPYFNPATGERVNVDTTTFGGIAWVVGHELYHELDSRMAKGEAQKKIENLMRSLADAGLLKGGYADLISSEEGWDALRKKYKPRWIALEEQNFLHEYGSSVTPEQAREYAEKVVDKEYIDAEIAGDFFGSLFGYNISNTKRGLASPELDRMSTLIAVAKLDRQLVSQAAGDVLAMRDSLDSSGVQGAERSHLSDLLADFGSALFFSNPNNATPASQYSAVDVGKYTYDAWREMPLEDQMDAACIGEVGEEHPLVISRKAPALFRNLDVPGLPIVMPLNKFFLCMGHGNYTDTKTDVHWHAVSFEQIAGIMDKLRKPVMTYKDASNNPNAKTGFTIVTGEFDRDNLPIVVHVRPNSLIKIAGKDVKVNLIASIYGKVNLLDKGVGKESTLEDIANRNLLMQIDKEKSAKLVQEFGERFPRLPTPDLGSFLAKASTSNSADGIIQKWTPVVKEYAPGSNSYSTDGRWSAVDIGEDDMYSPLGRDVVNLPTDKNGDVHISQIRRRLNGIAGLRDEAKAIGLLDYLAGRDVISKTELLGFVEDHTFTLTEDRRVQGPEYWLMKNAATGEIYADSVEFSSAAKAEAENRGLRYDGYSIVDTKVDMERGTVQQTYAAYAVDGFGNRTELMRASSEKIESGGTRWRNFTIGGGDNYTESLFVMPKSTYTNPMMAKHWGSREGVLAHVRTKDFHTSNNGKVLLIEEMQSDWHNEGSRRGYESKGGPVPDAPYRNSYVNYLFKRMLMRAVEEDYNMLAWVDGASQMNLYNPYYLTNEKGNVRGLQAYVNEYDRAIPNVASEYGEIETVYFPKAAHNVTPARFMTLLSEQQKAKSRLNEINEKLRTGESESTDSIIALEDERRALSSSIAEMDGQMAEIRNKGEMDTQYGVTFQAIRVTDDLMDRVWDGLPRFSAADIGTDGMYSALEREIENLQWSKKGEMKADVLLKSLKNRAQKVRGLADEMKWADLEGALKSFGDTVNKDEFLDLIRRTGAPVLQEKIRNTGSQFQYVVIDENGEEQYYAEEPAVRMDMLEKAGPGVEFDHYETDYAEPLINPQTGEVVKIVEAWGYDVDNDEPVFLGEFYDYGTPVTEPDETKWRGYALEGGQDYTEHTYTLPGATYAGKASNTHWGEDAPGVLLHTREQTFQTPDGKKVLFIDEIQSDWHNDAIKAAQAEKRGEPHEDVPEAPYGRTYAEYAIKQMLLKAAREGYDFIAWAPPSVHMDRWNPWRIDADLNIHSPNARYLKGYQSTYGRDIPAAARRYGPEVDVRLEGAEGQPYASKEYYLAYEQMEQAYNKVLAAKDAYETKFEDQSVPDAEVRELRAKYDKAYDGYTEAFDVFEQQDSSPIYGGGPVESVPGIEITPELREKILAEGLPRYSAAGEEAMTADLVKLRDAQGWLSGDKFEDAVTAKMRKTNPATGQKYTRREARQAVKDDVYRLTGWWQDAATGVWEFGIPDSRARFIQSADERRTRTDERYAELKSTYQRMKELDRKNQLTRNMRETYPRIKDLFIKERSEKSTKPFYENGGVLEDVLRHEDLYKAYPELQDMKIKFVDLADGKHPDGRTISNYGYFDPETETLIVNKRLLREEELRQRFVNDMKANNGIDIADSGTETVVLSVILHEVQHAIQKIEGFDQGYTMRAAAEAQKAAMANRAKATQTYLDLDAKDPSIAKRVVAMLDQAFSRPGSEGTILTAVNPKTGATMTELWENGTTKLSKQSAIPGAVREYLQALRDGGIITDAQLQLLGGQKLRQLIEAGLDDRYVNVGRDGKPLSATELYKMTHGEQEAMETVRRLKMNQREWNKNPMRLPAETKRAEMLEKIRNKQFSAVDTGGDGAQWSAVDYEDWVAGKSKTDRQTISAEQKNWKGDNRANRAAVNIPKTGTKKGRVTNRDAQTIMNSGITNAAMAESMKSAIANGAFEHIPYKDSAAVSKVNKEIERYGWDYVYSKYEKDVLEGKASKDITATGITLYNNAVTNGDTYTAMNLASLMVKNSSSVGAALQAIRMMNRLTPEGKMYMAVRSIENIAEELRGIYGDEYKVRLPDTMLNAYRDALISGDEAEQKRTWKEIEQTIADQIPSNWKLKLNNWRYLAMLGNLRTHVRNLGGNAFFSPVRMAKQGLKAAGERLVLGKAGEGSYRTTAMLNPFSGDDRARWKAAWDSYDDDMELIQSGGKMATEKGKIENLRTVYDKAKFLEWLRRKNSDLLDREDTWFSRPAYAEALASFLKARGIDGDDFANGNVAPDVLNTAREHAILEAQKATYRDTNQFSEWVASLGKAGKRANAKTVQKIASGVMEAVLPFKKTPANILVRAVEYSPAEFAQVLFGDIKKVRQAQAETAAAMAKSDSSEEAIRSINQLKEAESLQVSAMLDHISSGLTGTVLLGLGALLAKLGIIHGGKDPDKEQAAFDELHGQQEYSIDIGGINYTIDWLAPEALPLFTGVTLFNKIRQMQQSGEAEGDDTDALTTAWNLIVGLGEPMLNMSMLSSVNELVSKMSYLDDATQLPALLGQIGYSYVSQYLPTVFGQVERITEDRRESTYYDRSDGVGKDIQYALGKTMNKLPGDYNQIPYLDAWGREQSSGSIAQRVFANMFSPGYIRSTEETELDNELQRLHDLGYEKMLPQRATQSTKVDQEYLTQDEYVSYARTKGQAALDGLTALTASSGYKAMTDEQKAKAVEKVYTDAKTTAENAVRELRGDNTKNTGAAKAGMDPSAYSVAKVIYDTAVTPSGYKTTASGDTPKWAKMMAILDDKSLSKVDKLKFINAEAGLKEDFKTLDAARSYYTESKNKAKK